MRTAQVTAGIYWNALLLKLKGVPFHAHPGPKPADGQPADAAGAPAEPKPAVAKKPEGPPPLTDPKLKAIFEPLGKFETK